MNYARMLVTLVVAALGFVSLASAASATTITSPAGMPYTGSVTMGASSWVLSGSFVTIECSSGLSFKVDSHGAGITAEGKVTGFGLGNCNYPADGISGLGTMVIHGIGSGNGTVTWSGGSFTFQTSVGLCGFSTNSTHIGTLTGGSKAVLGVASAKIPRTHGSFLCGSTATLNTTYVVNSPTSLFVD